MQNDRLTIEFDEDDGWLTLRTQSQSGITAESSFALRKGFSPADVHEALEATGWIRQDGSRLRLTCDIQCETIRDVVSEMLGYFDAPAVPSSELLGVQSAVSEYTIVQESGLEIPLYAYAWLDVMVREDLADAARSIKDVWSKSEAIITLERYCELRVEEVVSRYSQPLANPTGRMAASIRTRAANESRGAKAQ